MRARYCYWSVATGPYADRLESCVRGARAAGVFREFHVLADRSIEGCECYEAHECDLRHGLFKLHYLKVGMTRLNFDYFVWLDADSEFARNPVDLPAVLNRGPVHVPFHTDLAAVEPDRSWHGAPSGLLDRLMKEHGAFQPAWLGSSAFWIVHRDVIEAFYTQAMAFWHTVKEAGHEVEVAVALSFAARVFIGDPDWHRIEAFPHIWNSADHLSTFARPGDAGPIAPAIRHLGRI